MNCIRLLTLNTMDGNQIRVVEFVCAVSLKIIRQFSKRTESLTNLVLTCLHTGFLYPYIGMVMIFYNLSQNHVFFAQDTTTILLQSMSKRSISRQHGS